MMLWTIELAKKKGCISMQLTTMQNAMMHSVSISGSVLRLRMSG
jgi:hypothetical protein